ncbi:MAG: hypothetical protein KatS3mg115_2099 [Candidatus Poribacteria bacterium]|nr:MAG: hypothetical protein KatS3mg115_2099 [Candidatus Poribacteria bacterium]
MNKFALGTPAVIATFPATALAFRRGDIQEPEPVLRQVLRLEDLYALKGSGTATPEALDALRQADVPEGAAVQGPVARYDPFLYNVGPVVRTFQGGARRVVPSRSAPVHDREVGIIRSLSGQLVWDYRNGIVTVRAPRAQAVVGFLNGQEGRPSRPARSQRKRST